VSNKTKTLAGFSTLFFESALRFSLQNLDDVEQCGLKQEKIPSTRCRYLEFELVKALKPTGGLHKTAYRPPRFKANQKI
jgi:hypothetical protein